MNEPLCSFPAVYNCLHAKLCPEQFAALGEIFAENPFAVDLDPERGDWHPRSALTASFLRKIEPTESMRSWVRYLIRMFDHLEEKHPSTLFKAVTQSTDQPFVSDRSSDEAQKISNLSSMVLERFRSQLNSNFSEELALLEWRHAAFASRERWIRLKTPLLELNSQIDEWVTNHPLKCDPSKQISFIKEELPSHPEFCQLIQSNALLQEHFLSWSVKYSQDSRIFIRYPGLTTRFLNHSKEWMGRLTVFGSSALQANCSYTTSSPGVMTELTEYPTLLIDGEAVNVLDLSRTIQCKNFKTITTLEEIFNTIANKERDVGSWEMLQKGLLPINVLTWTHMTSEGEQRFDISGADWWNQFPTFLTLSAAEANRRYEVTVLSGKNWGFVFRANCTPTQLEDGTTTYFNPEGMHCYLEVAISLGDGSYHILPFGPFAHMYPQTESERKEWAGKSYYTRLSFLDENVFNTDRQHFNHLYTLEPEVGLRAMEILRQLHASCMNNEIPFQLQVSNCASILQPIAEQIADLGGYPRQELFQFDYWDLEPQVMRGVFKWLKTKPKEDALGWLKVVFYFVGGSHSVELNTSIGKCQSTPLLKHPDFHNFSIRSPAGLIRRRVEGTLPAVAVKSTATQPTNTAENN